VEENPIHGSGWMVQIQPTEIRLVKQKKSHPREWMDYSCSLL